MGKQNKPDRPNIFALAAELQSQMESAVGKQEHHDTPQAGSQASLKSLASTVLKRQKTALRTSWRASKEPPAVSIIVPVTDETTHNTVLCLESLSKQVSRYTFEVIVVDGASSNTTRQFIGAIPGVRMVTGKANQSFATQCTTGVKSARGTIIVFLRSDADVQGNWLDALVKRLESDASVGMACSKVTAGNGELLAAGGIIYKDGSLAAYGEHLRGDDFEYNFIRDTDFDPSGSLALYTADFNKLKGFERRLAGSPYAMPDLAMGMRYKLGKRIVYEPHSIAALGNNQTATQHTDAQAVFVKKWSKELARHHFAPDTNVYLAARAGKPKRLLIVDSLVPEYNSDSGSLRMHQIIKASIKLGYAVTFYADNRVASLPYTPELQAMGVEVVYGGNVSLRDFYKARQNMYDVALLSRPTVAIWHLEYCKAYLPKTRLIYDTVDLHFLRIGRQATVENKPKLHAEADKWQQLEYYLMENTDVTLVVSSDEQALLSKTKPGTTVQVLSNINPANAKYAYDQKRSFKDTEGLLFIGTYNHTPNRDAATWFVKSILPLVRQELPDIPITLLGSHPTAAITKLASDTIDVPGFIDEVEPYFYQARLFICPVRFGAGVKGKVSQALSCDLPVVSTSVGVEGMHLTHNVSCLVAETAEDFAKQIIRLYNDQKLWGKLQRNAGVTYQQYFSEEAGLKALQHALTNR